MNAVAGIVHLDGGQASSRDLDLLLESLGASSTSAHTVTSGDARFSFLGAAAAASPCSCLGGTAIATAAARLDNRDELCRQLDVAEPASVSDESLIVRAFERWGDACPEHLNGDWVMAVWQPARQQLFLARDHFGNTALYFAKVGATVAFATELRAFASVSWIPKRLNEVRVASLLIGGGVDDVLSTVYRDVSRLPPSYRAAITPGIDRVARYWKVEDTPVSDLSEPGQRADRLRATLRSAVQTRLSGGRQVGAMLSGGLDSGAVAAFAAEYLSSHHRRLTAFTSVPAFPTRSLSQAGADEGPRAAEIVRSFESVDHVLIDAAAVTPMTGVRRGLAIHGEPSIAAANYIWITEILADAKARGIATILTGQVGDFVMAGRPAVPSLRRDWSERNYRAMLKRLAPDAIQRLRRVDWQPWRLTELPWQSFSLVNAEFARQTRLAERLEDRRRSSSIERQATSNVGAIWSSLAAAYGLSVLDPLQDKRVMELMFSATRPVAAGRPDRWLFRQSLAGVLPDRVRLNRRKGLQSADIVDRLKASWTEVEAALSVAEASPLARQCLDMKACRAIADSLRMEEPPRGARRRAFTLINGLSTALFLAETWE